MGSTYRIVRGDFGWHAVPLDGIDETRVFETREAALAWCDQRVVTAIADDLGQRDARQPVARR